MTKRAAIALTSLAALTGCDILFPEDPREGAESEAQCAARIESLLGPTNSYRNYEGADGVPIFTYDITKLSLEDTKELIVPGSDETAGTRLMSSTNEESTAVDAFMNLEVDESGAFFLARDPALYRVRSEREPVENIIATGCARQREGMRLIMVEIASAPQSNSSTDASTEQETSS